MYASVFSPAAVCALDRRTGKLVWRRKIPGLGGSTVHLVGGTLFAKTANTLYAMKYAPSPGCPVIDSEMSVTIDSM